MQVRKNIYSLTRSSIQLRRNMERNRLDMVVENHCSVGYVARIIVRGIFCSIKVVDPRYIVLGRHIQLVMLVIEFLGSMQLWTIGRQIIRHLSLRWMVSFVIKLILF